MSEQQKSKPSAPPPSIAFLIRGGFDVHATCNGCQRTKPLDLIALAVAHGETAILLHLAQRFRCGECGHRGATLSVAPGRNAPGYARSHV